MSIYGYQNRIASRLIRNPNEAGGIELSTQYLVDPNRSIDLRFEGAEEVEPDQQQEPDRLESENKSNEE